MNCFEEELPLSLCGAEQAEVLSLNGLGAAEGCTDSVEFPLSGVGLFNTIGGTVPACVWALRNLSVLHLTGNGLTGELVRSLPVNSRIVDLSLSHNQLSGTIPLDILNIATLDMSYNQLTGEYQNRTRYTTDTKINLQINRLSGQLPVSELKTVRNGSLTILQGNLFSCKTIPGNDAYSEDYVCGSRNFNYSLFVFVSAFGMAMLVVLLACWARLAGGKQYQHRLVVALYSRCVLLWTYLTYLTNLDMRDVNSMYAPAVRKIVLLSGTFVDVTQNTVWLLVITLVTSLALYLLKTLDSSEEYSTHSKTYAWFWTLAYMRGVVPAGMLLMLWICAISACFYRIVVNPRRTNESTEKPIVACRDDVDDEASASTLRGQVVPVGAAFVLNACVTIIVNTLYIYSTQQALCPYIHFCIQLSLSIFRLVYIVVVFPFLSGPIRSAVANVRFRFILLTINNLMIPLVVTALTSDACFQVLTLDIACPCIAYVTLLIMIVLLCNVHRGY